MTLPFFSSPFPIIVFLIFLSSRIRHTRYWRDWSSDVCSSDLGEEVLAVLTRAPEPVEGRREPLRRQQRLCGFEPDRRLLHWRTPEARAGAARAVRAHHQDRKSVVEGKGVAGPCGCVMQDKKTE